MNRTHAVAVPPGTRTMEVAFPAIPIGRRRPIHGRICSSRLVPPPTASPGMTGLACSSALTRTWRQTDQPRAKTHSLVRPHYRIDIYLFIDFGAELPRLISRSQLDLPYLVSVCVTVIFQNNITSVDAIESTHGMNHFTCPRDHAVVFSRHVACPHPHYYLFSPFPA